MVDGVSWAASRVGLSRRKRERVDREREGINRDGGINRNGANREGSRNREGGNGDNDAHAAKVVR